MQHALLVWDTFSGHMTEEVVEELQKKNNSNKCLANSWLPQYFVHMVPPHNGLDKHDRLKSLLFGVK